LSGGIYTFPTAVHNNVESIVLSGYASFVQIECLPGSSPGFQCNPICFGKNLSDPSICSGNGFCSSPDVCSCSKYYTGRECQIPIKDFETCPGNQPCTFYSYGEGPYLGYSGSGDRLTPGLFPIPTNGVVTQISDSTEKHILILMDNSTVYSFGQNGVILFLFIKVWSTWDWYKFFYFNTNKSELGRGCIRCNWNLAFRSYQK
jgi:hypothetical protein